MHGLYDNNSGDVESVGGGSSDRHRDQWQAFSLTLLAHWPLGSLGHIFWRSMEVGWIGPRLSGRRGLLLDVGCGDGAFLATVLQHFGRTHLRVVGVDYSRPALAEAKEKGCYEAVIVADIKFLPFRENAFPTILCNSVLEHVAGCRAVVREFARVTPLGAQLLVGVMNSAFLSLHPLMAFLDRLSWSRRAAEKIRDWVNRRLVHINLWEPEAWYQLLGQEGFDTTAEAQLVNGLGEFVWSVLAGLSYLPSKVLPKPWPGRLFGSLIRGIGILPHCALSCGSRGATILLVASKKQRNGHHFLTRNLFAIPVRAAAPFQTVPLDRAKESQVGQDQ